MAWEVNPNRPRRGEADPMWSTIQVTGDIQGELLRRARRNARLRKQAGDGVDADVQDRNADALDAAEAATARHWLRRLVDWFRG